MDTTSKPPVIGAPEALLQENSGKPLKATVFDYQTPADLQKPRGVVRLCRSDIVYANMTLIKSGGENNLHAHTANDGIWIVIKGRVKFYGIDDVLLAELGPLQGIQIPRGFFYWFESASPEMLEILQIEAIDKSIESKRLDGTPRRPNLTQTLN